MATPITAADVKKLRDQTGAGMMECKNALVEANGDFEEAVTILRKRGLASAAKKAGRAANEGLIAHKVAPDHSSGILVEVNCESDFVARTPDFVQLRSDRCTMPSISLSRPTNRPNSVIDLISPSMTDSAWP